MKRFERCGSCFSILSEEEVVANAEAYEAEAEEDKKDYLPMCMLCVIGSE